MKWLKELVEFVKAVANDPRIPDRDKKIVLALVALVVSPVDLIPDWIPVFGVLDDLAIIALVLDYLFNHLDQDILLSHYPWGMKSYTRLRRMAQAIAMFTPGFLKRRIWQYRPSVYK